jgi:hypothetical protein
MNNECREAFEKEFSQCNLKRDPNNTEKYFWYVTDNSWYIFKTAWNLRPVLSVEEINEFLKPFSRDWGGLPWMDVSMQRLAQAIHDKMKGGV